jgi:dihydrofolate reductase
MNISLLAAVSRNGVIGRDGQLPWHLPADLKRFKRLTLGHPVIMGRKTYDSILKSLGKPLPGRQNIVVSRSANPVSTGSETLWVDSMEAALRAAASAPGGDSVYVIGGGEIYMLALPRATHLDITAIARDFEGDARFPAIDWSEWEECERETGSEEGLDYAFVTYRRRPPMRKPNEMPARG